MDEFDKLYAHMLNEVSANNNMLFDFEKGADSGETQADDLEIPEESEEGPEAMDADAESAPRVKLQEKRDKLIEEFNDANEASYIRLKAYDPEESSDEFSDVNAFNVVLTLDDKLAYLHPKYEEGMSSESPLALTEAFYTDIKSIAKKIGIVDVKWVHLGDDPTSDSGLDDNLGDDIRQYDRYGVISLGDADEGEDGDVDTDTDAVTDEDSDSPSGDDDKEKAKE